ncbi:endonuclease/exonuclease/phosphatase family protein [Actinopolymorpha pittospori]
MTRSIGISRRGAFAAAAALVAAAVLGAATPAAMAAEATPSAPRPVALRVATYNIHAGAGEDGVFDLARTADAIRSLDADVIGLQEVDVHWDTRSDYVDEARELARQLRMRVFFAPIYDFEPATEGAPRRQYGVAVLSRYPIVQAENHDITRLSTQDPNPVPAPALGFAEVTLAVRGARVHVYSTHLDYRPDPAVRRMQVDDMLAILAADKGPKVLVGDLNAEATAPELAQLWEQGLVDAAPNGGKTYPATSPVSRIDVVSVSPDITVRGAHEIATTASDHRPVVTDLVVPRGR